MNKYKNTKTIVDGITFDSKLEARAYKYFRDHPDYVIMELQPKFVLQEAFEYRGKKIREIAYKADFLIQYRSKPFVVDAKGVETPEFKIKLKMLHYEYPSINFILFKSIKQFEEEIKKFEL
jgi:hypothetical protein